MANRRMISIGIINSAKFLKMPVSSRLLYYDLCLRADDDGVVEGFNVLRMTGVSEDDLKVLASKGYVRVLNEDLVSYITDWTEHNKIRADRKVDSIYKDLLLQVLPDVKLLESKQRSDRKNKSKEIVGTDNGTSHGCPMSAEDRIGQDRIGQDSLGKDKIDSSQSSIDFSIKEVFDHFEECGFMVTPMLLEKISADVKLYGSKNMIDAATESMERGKINNYKYVTGILQNWQTEGRKENKDGGKGRGTGNSSTDLGDKLRNEGIGFSVEDL